MIRASSVHEASRQAFFFVIRTPYHYSVWLSSVSIPAWRDDQSFFVIGGKGGEADDDARHVDKPIVSKAASNNRIVRSTQTRSIITMSYYGSDSRGGDYSSRRDGGYGGSSYGGGGGSSYGGGGGGASYGGGGGTSEACFNRSLLPFQDSVN